MTFRPDHDAQSEPTRFTLSDRQRIAWLRLYRTDNVGPATFRDMINHCGSAEAALEMLPELTTRGGRLRHPNIPTISQAEDELAAIERRGAHVIGLGEPGYPAMLRVSDQAPPLITAQGDITLLQASMVAIVGSRNASMAGLTMARRLAQGLGATGHVVASGFARGIDRAAHEAAAPTGTVAVMAGGIDKPYPPQNIELAERLIADGQACFITEMPLGWVPKARDFPRRNRIIAGLAPGLIVVEAAARSGSLISARRAAEMGRIVMAVPGSPLDPRAHGTNTLIRDGATLIQNADDVVELLAPLTGLKERHAIETVMPSILPSPATMPPTDSDRQRMTDLLGPVAVDIDDLIAQSGLTPGQAWLILLELDLAGRIERQSGSRFALVV